MTWLTCFCISSLALGTLTSDVDVCSSASGSCTLSSDIYDAMTEEKIELAEEGEATLMQVQLLQTLQLQQRSSNVSNSEKEIPSLEDPSKLDGSRNKDTGKHISNIGEQHHLIERVAPGEVGETNHPSPVSVMGLKTFNEPVMPSTAAAHGDKTLHTTWLPESNVGGLPLPQSASKLEACAIIAVFLLALVVQILMCTGVVQKLPKIRLFQRHGFKNGTIRSFVQQLSVTSALDIEANMPPASSSDEKFLQPVSSGGPVRLEMKIEGTFDRSTIHAPLTRHNCVMYSATAKYKGERKAVAHAVKQSDFIASMADAPWIKVLVSSSDVNCFDMHCGQWNQSERFGVAPDELKTFVVENMHPEYSPKNPLATKDAKQIDFEECSLLVGSIVTLVGKLCRGPGGQLILQKWQEHDKKGKQKNSWFGNVLASDDSSLHGRVVAGGMQRGYGTI